MDFCHNSTRPSISHFSRRPWFPLGEKNTNWVVKLHGVSMDRVEDQCLLKKKNSHAILWISIHIYQSFSQTLVTPIILVTGEDEIGRIKASPGKYFAKPPSLK
jgi:hypothetical protein